MYNDAHDQVGLSLFINLPSSDIHSQLSSALTPHISTHSTLIPRSDQSKYLFPIAIPIPYTYIYIYTYHTYTKYHTSSVVTP